MSSHKKSHISFAFTTFLILVLCLGILIGSQSIPEWNMNYTWGWVLGVFALFEFLNYLVFEVAQEDC